METRKAYQKEQEEEKLKKVSLKINIVLGILNIIFITANLIKLIIS